MKIPKFIQNIALYTALTASALGIAGCNVPKSNEQAKTANPIQRIYTEGKLNDSSASTCGEGFVDVTDRSGNRYAADIVHDKDKGDTGKAGTRLNINEGKVKANLDFFGVAEKNQLGGGINLDGIVADRFAFGGIAEKLEKDDSDTTLWQVYGGPRFFETTFKLGFGQRDTDGNITDIYSASVEKDLPLNFFLGSGINFEDNKGEYKQFLSAVLGKYGKERGKEFGFRLYGTSDLDGAYCVDGIFALDSTFSRASNTGIISMFDAGFMDESVVPNLLDSRRTYLHDRTRTFAFELVTKGNKEGEQANTLNLGGKFPSFYGITPFAELGYTRTNFGENRDILRGLGGLDWKGFRFSYEATQPIGGERTDSFLLSKVFDFLGGEKCAINYCNRTA